MGLFGKKKKQQQQQQKQEVADLHPWALPSPTYEVVMVGDRERKVYTYDSRPLAAVKSGQSIVLEAFRGDAAMTSVHTGYYSDNFNSDDTLMMYNGQPIGFMSIPKDKVFTAAQLGYALKVNAVCRGMLEGYKGVKEIVALAPNRIYLYDWIPGAPDDRPLRDRDEYFSFNEYDEEDFKNIAIKDEWVFQDARIEMIPTPKGSSAKPHIGIYSSDGMQVSEVAAKNNYYNGLIDFMGKYKGFTVKATRQKSAINDGSYYRIEILGK